MDEQREAELAAKLIDAEAPDRVVPVLSKPALTPNVLAAMARDIATNVYEIEEVVAKYGLTPAQFAVHVHSNGYFQSLLQSYAAEWESIKSTNKRLAFQAAVALEETLPDLARRMGSTREDFADAIGAAKLFTQLAGAGSPPGGSQVSEAGQRFSIQINIGDRKVSLEADSGGEVPRDAEVPRVATPLLEFTAGKRNSEAAEQHSGETGIAIPLQTDSKVPGEIT